MTCERSFSDLSPREKACWRATRRVAESYFCPSLGFGTLVWEFHHIHLLIALVNLNTDASRRWHWWRGNFLCRRRVMNDRLHGRWCSDAPVQTPGVGGRNFVLLGVERIAQHQLNVSFGTGK